MAVTKSDIVEELHKILERFGYPRKKTFDIVEDLIELIKRDLEQGNDVLISGFGKFCVKEKKARRGRNPATGESLILEPRRVVTFKCSGKLRDLMNNGKKKNRVSKGLRIR